VEQFQEDEGVLNAGTFSRSTGDIQMTNGNRDMNSLKNSRVLREETPSTPRLRVVCVRLLDSYLTEWHSIFSGNARDDSKSMTLAVV